MCALWIILIILIIAIICFLIFQKPPLNQSEVQPFMVSTNATDGPLINFDGFDTAEFKFNLDSLPDYDPTYMSLGDSYTNWTDSTPTCTYKRDPLDFDKDCFFKFEGRRKVRKYLVPSNYTDDSNYAIANFEDAPDVQVTNPNWTKYSTIAPEGSNTYFKPGY